MLLCDGSPIERRPPRVTSWLTLLLLSLPATTKVAAIPDDRKSDLLVAQERTSAQKGRSDPGVAGTPSAPAAKPLSDGLVVETVAGSEKIALEGLEIAIETPPRGGVSRLRLGTENVPLDELLFLRFPEFDAPLGGVELILRGGDRLVGKILRGGDERVEMSCRARTAGHVTVDLEYVRAIVVRPSRVSETPSGRVTEDLLKARPSADKLYLESGDVIDGIMESVQKDGIRFSSETLGPRALLFGFAKVKAVLLAEFEEERVEKAPTKGLRAAVHLTDGGRLTGELRELGKEELMLRHPRLGEMRMKTSVVSEIAIRGGRCQFLSDLDPVRTKEYMDIPFGPKKGEESTYFPFKRDSNCTGKPLRMAGKTYSKGLGVHSYSLLEYELGGAYKQFRVTIGLDASAHPAPGTNALGGSVVFRVYLDGKKIAVERLSYRDPPRELGLPVAGGDILGLEVDFGNFLSDLDRANWAYARVVK